MTQRRIFSALSLSLAAALGACTATVPVVEEAAKPAATETAIQESVTQAEAQQPEAIVAEQSKAYWRARTSGKVEEAYAWTPPSYRAVHGLDTFRLRYGAPPALGEQTIVSVQCEAQRCKVTSRFQAFVPMVPAAQASVALSDVWVQEQGQWWVFLE